MLKVTPMSEEDGSIALAQMLDAKGRSLTVSQYATVLDAFKGCPLPLFLVLAVHEAVQWHSYDPPERTTLEGSMRGLIGLQLFRRAEKTHGEVLVRRALGYLTIALEGLTASELEDVLSLDDVVLDDVFVYAFFSVVFYFILAFLVLF
jgi:hypothetical protein